MARSQLTRAATIRDTIVVVILIALSLVAVERLPDPATLPIGIVDCCLIVWLILGKLNHQPPAVSHITEALRLLNICEWYRVNQPGDMTDATIQTAKVEKHIITLMTDRGTFMVVFQDLRLLPNGDIHVSRTTDTTPYLQLVPRDRDDPDLQKVLNASNHLLGQQS